MRRNTQILLGAAGAGIAFYGFKRFMGIKRYNSFPYGYGIKLKRAVTVHRAPEDCYQFWRNLENIPKLVDDLLSVDVIDERLSHWKLQVPGGFKMEWDAEITVDRQNEIIGWRTLGNPAIAHAGYIRLDRATGERGTVVRIALQYNPPGRRVGAMLSTLLGERPEGLVGEALRKFKQLAEAGEIPTVQEKHLYRPEEVEIASEDSFPASDAPAWTGTTGPSSPRR